MITIHSPHAEDFSTLGFGVLTPTECVISEVAGGMYELKMTHPMDDDLRWTHIETGRIIKAPAPMRETPLLSIDVDGTITREIYKTSEKTKLRSKSGGRGKALKTLKKGVECVRLSVSGDHARVALVDGGRTGWVASADLEYVGSATDAITDGYSRVVQPRQTGDQLFRIVSVERDSARRSVSVTAQHVFYDLAGNIVGDVYAPADVAANLAAQAVFDMALNEHPFELHAVADGPVSGEYTGQNIVYALLDPDEGIVPQASARLVRDNYDVFVLPDDAKNRGVVIRHGKNLRGATMTTDMSAVVTRIQPVGRLANDERLLLDTDTYGATYIDSGHIDDYPIVYAREIEYDVQVGEDDGQYDTTAEAREKLAELARADFDSGIDLPAVSLEVDFIALENTAEYADYADLQAVYLYDTVGVIVKNAGINADLRVTGYEWDALRRRYIKVTLGELVETRSTVYGTDIASGSVNGNRIIKNTLDGAAIRDLTVGYAAIKKAAIERLSADSITALSGAIANLTVSDELYAAFANLFELVAGSIESGSLDTDVLAAQIANIVSMQVAVSDVGYARVKDLDTDEAIIRDGVAGSLYIDRLAVTSANLLNATIGNLVISGDDGSYYKIFVGSDGTIRTEAVTVTAGEISAGETAAGEQIVNATINAESINGQNIKGKSAVIETIFTAALTAGQITANEAIIASAVIPALSVSTITASGNSISVNADQMLQIMLNAYGNMTQWFTFDRDGLTIRAPAYVDENGVEQPESDWYTVTDNSGYHIRNRTRVEDVGSFEYDRFQTNAIRMGNMIARPNSRGGWTWRYIE